MGTLPGTGLRRRVDAIELTEERGARLLQAAFALLVLLDLALRVAGGVTLGLNTWPAAGVALLALITVGAAVLDWSRAPMFAYVALPLLDLAVLGLVRLAPSGSGASLLVVLPAMWLGRHLRVRGAVVAGVATVLLVAVPGLLYFGSGGADLSRSVLPPVVALVTALAVAEGLRRIEAGHGESEQRGVALANALETIEHQRRVAAAILDTVDVGLVLLDRNGAYESINRRHADFMRLAFPEGHAGWAGQLGLVYASDGTTVAGREDMPTFRASRGEEFDDIRMWVGDDPRTRRALSVSARTVVDADGKFAGAALAYKDVTEFMRALRVKDEFVASVSHELRTPLTSIMGYVHILRERDDLAREALDQLAVVNRNADRLGRLVADLLHTAQIDDGPVYVVRTQSDLSEIVRDSLRAAVPAAEAAQVSVDVDLPESLPMRLDAQRIAQVVDNLVSNAIKYTPAGGRVGVCLTLDGSRAELSVTDTGIGIAPADRDRLFTRFFRTRQAEERSIQGVGLGLNIAKAIVESHGGRIVVDSDLGRGSAFRVRLPLEAG